MDRLLLLFLTLVFADLHAGTLTVSGEAGSLFYRIERHDSLVDRTGTEVMGRLLDPVTITAEGAAWVTLVFYGPNNQKLRVAEVYLGPEDRITVSCAYDPADLDRVVLTYDGHPAPEAQACRDALSDLIPINRARDILYRYRDAIAALQPGTGEFSRLIDRDFCSDNSVAAAPYRQRIRYRYYSVVASALRDDDVLPPFDSTHRTALVEELFTGFDPEGPGAFHGRSWGLYRLAQAARLETRNRVSVACGGDSLSIGGNMAGLLRYREENWFPFLYAKQLQFLKRTYSSNPELFVEELEFFRCLEPDERMVKVLEGYYP